MRARPSLKKRFEEGASDWETINSELSKQAGPVNDESGLEDIDLIPWNESPTMHVITRRSFEEVLFKTRPYRRQREDELLEKASSLGEGRLSLITGLSHSNLSTIAVYALPLCCSEVQNSFRYDCREALNAICNHFEKSSLEVILLSHNPLHMDASIGFTEETKQFIASIRIYIALKFMSIASAHSEGFCPHDCQLKRDLQRAVDKLDEVSTDIRDIDKATSTLNFLHKFVPILLLHLLCGADLSCSGPTAITHLARRVSGRHVGNERSYQYFCVIEDLVEHVLFWNNVYMGLKRRSLAFGSYLNFDLVAAVQSLWEETTSLAETVTRKCLTAVQMIPKLLKAEQSFNWVGIPINSSYDIGRVVTATVRPSDNLSFWDVDTLLESSNESEAAAEREKNTDKIEYVKAQIHCMDTYLDKCKFPSQQYSMFATTTFGLIAILTMPQLSTHPRRF